MKTWQEEGFDSPEQQMSVNTLKSKMRLEHGDYCEVTREQAVELLTIEGGLRFPNQYVVPIFQTSQFVCAIYQCGVGIVLSGIQHGDYITELPFHDFKQRLVNTVKV